MTKEVTLREGEITCVWSEQGSRNGKKYSHAQYWCKTDGGREAAGYSGKTSDCVVRAIALATMIPYKEVYDELFRRNREFAKLRNERARRTRGLKASPRNGTFKDVYRPYLEEQGFVWVPTMKIGSGCKVHFRSDELPKGRLVVRVAKHLAAMIDGVVYDTWNSTMNGKRCVYGYFKYQPSDKPVQIKNTNLLYELYDHYVRASYEDGSETGILAYKALDRETGHNLNVAKFTMNEAEAIMETLSYVAHPNSYDMMHQSTKRGYQSMEKKLREQLNYLKES